MYEFWVLPPGGSWTSLGAYGSSATFAWNTAGLAAGSYDLGVWVKDETSPTSNYDASSVLPYTLNPAQCISPAPSVLDRSVATNLATATAFLYSGSNPQQSGVSSGTIVPATAAVIRGQVLTSNGSGLAGASITIVNHPELGQSVSLCDGSYDMAVNGGQPLRVRITMSGYLPVERTVQTHWQEYDRADDATLVPLDASVTSVSMPPSVMQVARANQVTDSAGTRQATLFIPEGTTATMVAYDGTQTPLSTMSVRATEYSVGASGPSAVPGTLPGTVGYAYAVELSSDEAIAAGAKRVTFSQPLYLYSENFLGLLVGTSVPGGYYDTSYGAWLSASNGLVLEILSITNGEATVDLDGDGVADTGSALTAIGMTDAELEGLASLYAVHETLWRVPVPHFSAFGTGWDDAPPAGAPDDAAPCLAPATETFCGTSQECQSGPPQPCGEGLGVWAGFDFETPQQGHYWCCGEGYAFSGQYDGMCSSNSCTTASSPNGGGGGAGPGFGGPGPMGSGGGGCDDPNASTIHCQRRSLGEDLPIAGTPFSLHYESERQRGSVSPLTIPITAQVLSPATSAVLKISVAGQVVTETVTSVNQSAPFTWNGQDAFGRVLQGTQPVHARIFTQYPGVYQNAGTFGNGGNGSAISGSAALQPFSVETDWDGFVESWDAQPEGFGGWTLNVHHTYDVTGHILRLRGRFHPEPARRPADHSGPWRATGAPRGPPAMAGPRSAPRSALPPPSRSAPMGALYVVDARSCIRRITPSRSDHHVRRPVLERGLRGRRRGPRRPVSSPRCSSDVAVGPDGSVFIAAAGNNRVRRVDPTGVISTVAGTGSSGFSGDGGSAAQATLAGPTGVDVTADGSLYVADLGNLRVRRVSPEGIIATVAGNGSGASSTGNEGPATAASLASAVRVRVGRDGSFYLAETAGNVIRRVGPDGVIRAFAGGGGAARNTLINSSMVLQAPSAIAVGPDGSVFVSDQSQTVRRIDARGIVTVVAGVAGVSTFAGDNGAAATATMGTTLGLGAAPDGTVYLAGTSDNRVRHVAAALPGFTSPSGSISIPSPDGAQVYVFDGTGRHLQTLDAFTGATLYGFSYNATGELASVTDVNGDVTQFNHDAAGNLTSIASPFGVTTQYTPDANGYLASATDPTNATTTFTYGGAGLLQSKTDARGGVSHYTFDSQGRLTQDQDAAGNAKTLSESDAVNIGLVTLRTPSGVQTQLSTQMDLQGNLLRDDSIRGFDELFRRTPGGSTTVIGLDSTKTVTTDTPDPRFGLLAPVQTVTTTTPLGLITSTTTTSRSITTSGGSLATFLEQTNVNGNTWQRLFNAATRTWTTISPAGRTQTMTVDAAGRPTQISVPNVAPFTLTYDAHGHLVTTTQGSRTWTQGFDARGYLGSTTDPLGNAVTFTNDALGRPTTTALADARTLGTTYDGDGNTTQIVLPSTDAHAFAFTPVNLMSSYTPPSLGSGLVPRRRTHYDSDRRLTNVTSTPTAPPASYTYDSRTGLFSSTVKIPQGTLSYGYDSNTVYLDSIRRPDGVDVQYSFDGFLRTKLHWSGFDAVSFAYDSNFRVVTETAASSAITLGYDPDGLLTGAGSISITRDSSNGGRITGTTLGSISDSTTYDANHGLFATYGARSTAGTPSTPRASSATSTAASPRRPRPSRARLTSGPTRTTPTAASPTSAKTEARPTSTPTTPTTTAPPSRAPRARPRPRLTTPRTACSPTAARPTRTTPTATSRPRPTEQGRRRTPTTSSATSSRVALPSGSTVTYLVDGENRRLARRAQRRR